MTDREIMKQALEALDGKTPTRAEKMREAGYTRRPSLREFPSDKPARQEQEPVVWMYQDKSTHEVRFQKHMRGFVDHGATYETPLYTAPQRREWVGLTEQEQEVLWDEAVDRQEHFCSQYGDFADSIEAKLREKNT